MSVTGVLQDIRWYSDRMMGSVDALDKVCKCVVGTLTLANMAIALKAIVDHGENIKRLTDYYYEPISNAIVAIKPFTDLTGALGLFTFVGKWVIKKDGKYEWEGAHIQKIFSWVCMTGAKTIEMATFLNNMKILQLGAVAAKHTFKLAVGSGLKLVLAPLEITKNILVIASGCFNISDAVEDKKDSAKKIDNAAAHKIKWRLRHGDEGDTRATIMRRLNGKLETRAFDGVDGAGKRIPKLSEWQKDKARIIRDALNCATRADSVEYLNRVKASLDARADGRHGTPLSDGERKILDACEWYLNYLNNHAGETMEHAYKKKITKKVDRWAKIETAQIVRGSRNDQLTNWKIVYEVGKIAITVIGTVGTILALSTIGMTAVPFLVLTTVLGLALGGLDIGKYMLDLKIKDLFKKEEFKVPDHFVTRLAAAAA